MTSSVSAVPVRQLPAQAGLNFRDLCIRYSHRCWASWKKGKTNDLRNRDNPFVGGPAVLLAAGFKSVENSKGELIPVSKLTRLRLRDLSDTSLLEIGSKFDKNLLAMKQDPKKGGKDVVHQEFVDTFEENITNDPKHLLNNLVSATAVIDTVFTHLAGPTTTAADLIVTVQGILDETPETQAARTLVSTASRMSWIGRACQDGSWKNSGDFNFLFELTENTQKIDEYVVVPVLTYLLEDLKNGFSE